jgi:hypothetical protein
MKILASLLAIAAAAVIATPVLADDSAPPLTCHVAAAGEKPTAMAKMSDSKTMMMVCVPTQMMMASAMKTIGTVAAKTRHYGPNIDGLLTTMQIDAAWKKWTDETFNIHAPSSN